MSPTHDINLEKTNPQPLIAAMYVRVSTGRQEKEETKDSQIDEIKQRIELDQNIIHLENIFIDDGWTGEILQRPALDMMRDAAKSGKFQVLYVYDRGRLSRSYVYQEIILEDLRDQDVQFITLHDIEAKTPEEKVMQSMQGVFHEYERVKIVERMRRGKLYKARTQVLINGNALYGYSYIKKTDTTLTHYEINEEEARVVRMIFDWVGIEGISLREVIKRLYDLKISPRKGKSEFWTKGPIVRILQCRTYIDGMVYYNKWEAIVAKNPMKNVKYKRVKRTSRRLRPEEEWIHIHTAPVIVQDQALFDKVQGILETNQKYARKNRKYDYLLTSKIYCECGNRRVGDGSSKYGHYYYRCTERILNFPGEKKCKIPGVNAEALDTTFWRETQKFLTNPDSLKEAAEEYLRHDAQTSASLDYETEKLKTSIEQIKEEELRYGKAYGKDVLEFEQFQTLMKDCQKRKLATQKLINDATKRSKSLNLDTSQVKELCQEARKVLKLLNLTEKILIVKDIIEKVIIKTNREVEVWGCLPLASLKLGYEPEDRDCGPTQRRQVHTL